MLPLWPPITREDLRAAATRPGFDALFADLIRQMIAETAKGLTELDMPGGSGISTGGFDGVVCASEATVEVPAGRSVWELSVTAKSAAKAKDDFNKRLIGPGGEPTSGFTYVQVILSAWQKRRAWETECRSTGRWRDVRGLNLDGVYGWLERAPGTMTWLADRLGLSMPGVWHAADWFSRVWLPSTTIRLDENIVLAGRTDAANQLITALAAGQRVVRVGGDMTRDEFWAVVSAATSSAAAPGRDNLRARMLLVTDKASLARLGALRTPLILVLADPGLARDVVVNDVHQVVSLVGTREDADISVDLIDPLVTQELLVAEGLPPERASELGALARRSLQALRVSLAVNPDIFAPAWARNPDASSRRILLLGGWDAASAPDRAVVEEIAGCSYTQAEDHARSLAAVDDMPAMGSLATQWYVLAPADAWLILRPHLTHDDIVCFQNVVAKVLAWPEPRLDSDGRQRYSEALRTGVARTLALLGTTTAPIPAHSVVTGEGIARQAVRSILASANADRTYEWWLSLRDVVGLLAEAAPEEFLTAMREGLDGTDPLHARMFTDGTDAGLLGPGPAQTPFLWALEVLAWAPEHFDGAVDVLARLESVDPGGRYANRPSESLNRIFSCWHPTTMAGQPQRLNALKRLLRQQPRVARRLLIDIIPDGTDMQSQHARPRFRDWSGEPTLTREDVAANISAVADLLLGDLDDVPERYVALVAKIKSLSSGHRGRFAAAITDLGSRLQDDRARADVFTALRNKVAYHREYADTGFALPEADLEVMDKAMTAITPRAARYRVEWLFTSHYVELGDPRLRDDLDAQEDALRRLRAEAVGQVLAEGGIEAIADLASSSDYPHLVGTSLALHTQTLDDQVVPWLGQDSVRHAVAQAYLAERLLTDENDQLLDQMLATASTARVQAGILLAANPPERVWAKLPHLGSEVASAYWQGFRDWRLDTVELVLEAVEGLVSVGRFAAAIRLLALHAATANTVEAAQAAAAATEALLETEADPDTRWLQTHHWQSIIALLGRHREAVGARRIVSIEWRLFPVLGHMPETSALHAMLSTDPGFFAEIVGYVYPGRAAPAAESSGSSSGAPNQDGNTAATRATIRRLTAERAYGVLQSWRRCPGTRDDGTVDVDVLREWIMAARELLRGAGLLQSGDRQIGRILAYAAPDDDDGVHPPVAVRDLLEEVASDDVDQGLATELYNRRGVTTRGVYEGGEGERALAAGYLQAANASSNWPRTAKILRIAASDYAWDARFNDSDAERVRRGLD